MSDVEFKVTFTPEAVEAAVKRESYSEGVYFGTITSAERKLSATKEEKRISGFPMLVLGVKPLSDPSDVTSGVGRGITNYQCLPFPGPDWSNLDELDEDTRVEAERLLGIFTRNTHETMAALYPEEVPQAPRRVNGRMMYKGEEIDNEQADECSREAYAISGQVAAELWNGERETSELPNRGVYFRIGYDKGSNFPSVKSMWAEHPIDKSGRSIELVATDKFMVAVGGTNTATEGKNLGKKNGKTGKAKAAPKAKASKFAARR